MPWDSQKQDGPTAAGPRSLFDPSWGALTFAKFSKLLDGSVRLCLILGGNKAFAFTQSSSVP